MNKLEKPVKGKNIKHMLDAFFNKYIRKHFNQVNSIDFIISDLGERMADGGRNIKILRNDNPVRTNNPDWFPPKAQQTDHICTFLKQLIDNELGTKDSYVGLKVEVVTETKTYTWDVKDVEYYANSGTVILKTDPRQGISVECPAIVRLYIYSLLTSKAVSSIIYNSIVTSESKYNFILGERNIHKGEDNVWIFGKNNISGETNHNSLINGYNNDVDSYGNIVIGDSNKHRSLLGVTIGRYIKNFKQNSFLFGTGHDNSYGPSHEAVFGKYSNIDSDTVFAIGDGEDENTRHNVFEIKAGGAILDKDGNDIRNSGGQHVQSDWNETNNTKPAYIKNKPTIPAAQQPADWNATQGPTRILNKPTVINPVQSDWNETDNSKLSFIKNKPTIPAEQVNADWNATEGKAKILNKPTVPDAQIPSDWEETNSTKLSYIKNKPEIYKFYKTLNNVPTNEKNNFIVNSFSGTYNNIYFEVEIPTYFYKNNTEYNFLFNTIGFINSRGYVRKAIRIYGSYHTPSKTFNFADESFDIINYNTYNVMLNYNTISVSGSIISYLITRNVLLEVPNMIPFTISNNENITDTSSGRRVTTPSDSIQAIPCYLILTPLNDNTSKFYAQGIIEVKENDTNKLIKIKIEADLIQYGTSEILVGNNTKIQLSD